MRHKTQNIHTLKSTQVSTENHEFGAGTPKTLEFQTSSLYSDYMHVAPTHSAHIDTVHESL